MDYKKYVEAFNSGDDARLVQEWFSEDCIFQSGPRLLRGREELLAFLKWAHDGIREVIRPQVILQDESHVFAEIDMDFHATRDKLEFQFGPLKRGEFLTVKFFVLYFLRAGRIAHLKASTWPPRVGLSKASPRLGGCPDQRQAYL
jgi:hypothetical protein